MPYVSQTQHIDRVRGAIEGRLPAPAAPDAQRLVSSWQRSYEQYRLDPGSVVGPRVLTSAELREVQGKEEAFLRASGQCLTRLHEMIRVADYCVLLTDAHGVTIDYRLERDRRSDFKHAGLYIGSCWSEREEGTCAVANVLTDLAPITVHKIDHFRAAFTTLTCSASPIFAPTGELIGVLDASALQSPDNRDSQRLVFQLVRQSAALIEDGYFLNQTAQHWLLFGHQSRNFVEAQPEVLIAFDECGNIAASNRKAQECIAGLSGPRHIDEIFDTSAIHLHDVARGDTIVPLRLRASGALLYARIREPLKRVSRGSRALTGAGAGATAGASGSASLSSGSRDAGRHARIDALRDVGALGRFLSSRDARIARNAEVALRIAGKRLPILILGETGVGKEVFAHALHDSGTRRTRPFVAVNCGAIPESLIESELFGYAPGAFTGARSRGARGKIAHAHTGTLFLDEIGDMPLSLQTRLLRVLAEGEVMPLGGDTPVRVDIDVICATHRDLQRMVADGAFGWPGNIRQLRNVLRYACAVCDATRVDLRHLSPDVAAVLAPGHLEAGGRALTALAPLANAGDERARIVDALTRHQWHPNAAAQALGISRATLYRRIAKLGIVGPHRG